MWDRLYGTISNKWDILYAHLSVSMPVCMWWETEKNNLTVSHIKILRVFSSGFVAFLCVSVFRHARDIGMAGTEDRAGDHFRAEPGMDLQGADHGHLPE